MCMMNEQSFWGLVSEDYARTVDFRISFGIYSLCRMYQNFPLSLPQFTYVFDSYVADILMSASQQEESLFSPQQCCQKLDRLAELYQIDSFENPYIIERSIQVINNCPTTVSLAMLCQTLNLSPAYLSSVISKNTGVPFRSIVFCRRLITFVSLVCQEPNQILESIALQIGYQSVHQFCKSFRRNTGIIPSSLKHNIILIHDLQKRTLTVGSSI